MKAVQLQGYGPNEWLIDLEFSPWAARVHVLRTEGDTGTALIFPSKEAAEARIAEELAKGEQARIFKHDPVKATAAVVPLTPRRGRDGK